MPAGPGRGRPDARHGLRASDHEDPAGRPPRPSDRHDQVGLGWFLWFRRRVLFSLLFLLVSVPPGRLL